MLRTLALSAALALPLMAGGCSSMMGGDNSAGAGGPDASASTVSRDSQGAGAVPGAVTGQQSGATVGTPGDKNPPPKN